MFIDRMLTVTVHASLKISSILYRKSDLINILEYIIQVCLYWYNHLKKLCLFSQNDSNFLNTIHEAYLESLREIAAPRTKQKHWVDDQLCWEVMTVQEFSPFWLVLNMSGDNHVITKYGHEPQFLSILWYSCVGPTKLELC